MTLDADPFQLRRFVDAQARVYPDVLAELRGGRKRSHWMWFIFPQLAGLGSSALAERYAISSPAEARAYLAHPLLGPRLHECARLVTAIPDRLPGRRIEQIFPWPDHLKLRSSMTLFIRSGAAEQDCGDFTALLERFYRGSPDPATLALLDPPGPAEDR